jgi:hypothetical protein
LTILVLCPTDSQQVVHLRADAGRFAGGARELEIAITNGEGKTRFFTDRGSGIATLVAEAGGRRAYREVRLVPAYPDILLLRASQTAAPVGEPIHITAYLLRNEHRGQVSHGIHARFKVLDSVGQPIPGLSWVAPVDSAANTPVAHVITSEVEQQLTLVAEAGPAGHAVVSDTVHVRFAAP